MIRLRTITLHLTPTPDDPSTLEVHSFSLAIMQTGDVVSTGAAIVSSIAAR